MICEFTDISKQFTRVLRHGGCHEADGAVRWAYILSLLEGAEDWNKEKSFDGLGRSSGKPRMECCEDQNGTIIYIRAVQGHSHGVTINPNMFSLREIPLNWKDHTHSTRRSVVTTNQSWRMVDGQET